MAKQTGLILLKGTIGGLTFYESKGIHIVKQRNRAPSKSRYQNHKCYTNVRRNADWFSLAQKYASEVYRTLLKEEKDPERIWYPLRNKAQDLVREGLDSGRIHDRLKEELVRLKELSAKSKTKVSKTVIAPPGDVPLLPVVSLNKDKKQQHLCEEQSLKEEILLGRYYARTDNLSLASELGAYNTVLRELIPSENKTEEALLLSQRKGLKPTRKLRW